MADTPFATITRRDALMLGAATVGAAVMPLHDFANAATTPLDNTPNGGYRHGFCND